MSPPASRLLLGSFLDGRWSKPYSRESPLSADVNASKWFGWRPGGMVFFGGCGDSAALKEAREKDNIRTLARMYGQFMSSHRGNGPKNEQEFKQYLQGRREELAREEIADVDAL